MSDAVLDSLAEVEMRVQQVSHLMAGVAGDELVQACADLQLHANRFCTLAQEFLVQQPAAASLTMRLHKTAAALASCQENLARHAVLTQQSLQTLFPATKNDTYGVGVGARVRQPYGSAGRQSGEFHVITA